MKGVDLILAYLENKTSTVASDVAVRIVTLSAVIAKHCSRPPYVETSRDKQA